MNKKVSDEGHSRRGGDILKHLYLNDYAELDNKISYTMFLHNKLLVCEISTVRTLALNHHNLLVITLT